MRWISVKDRLPRDRILHAIVFNGTAPLYNQHVFQATWFQEADYFKPNEKGYKYMGEITHWMPLPAPPGLEYDFGPVYSGLPCEIDPNNHDKVIPI